jgi:hypothetical protein
VVFGGCGGTVSLAAGWNHAIVHREPERAPGLRTGPVEQRSVSDFRCGEFGRPCARVCVCVCVCATVLSWIPACCPLLIVNERHVYSSLHSMFATFLLPSHAPSEGGGEVTWCLCVCAPPSPPWPGLGCGKPRFGGTASDPASCSESTVARACNHWQTDGSTSLHIASQHGHLECVRALLGDPNVAINQQMVRSAFSSAWHAMSNHRSDVLPHPTHRAPAAACPGNPCPLLWLEWLCRHADGPHPTLRLPMDVFISQTNGTTPLYLASADGRTECVRLLVERGAAVNLAEVCDRRWRGARSLIAGRLLWRKQCRRLQILALHVTCGSAQGARQLPSVVRGWLGLPPPRIAIHGSDTASVGVALQASVPHMQVLARVG